MITNLLFTVLCLGLAFLVNRDAQALRRTPRAIKIRRDGDRQPARSQHDFSRRD